MAGERSHAEWMALIGQHKVLYTIIATNVDCFTVGCPRTVHMPTGLTSGYGTTLIEELQGKAREDHL